MEFEDLGEILAVMRQERQKRLLEILENHKKQTAEHNRRIIEAFRLDTALRALNWAKRTADVAKLNETHSTLYTAICDAVSATQEAIAHINDAPDA